MKTIGVLGGIGPQATMDFEARVHDVSQRLIPPRANGGYPPMVVHYCRHPPIIVNEDHTPRFPIEPDPRLLEAARRLGAMADFLVITSNGAHVLQSQVEEASGRKVLSMIDPTLAEVQQRQWRKVGILGLGEPFVYMKPLQALNLDVEIIDAELRKKLDGEIFKVMEGRNDTESSRVAGEAIAQLRGKHVDGIILGCTEIPFLAESDGNANDVLNPLQLLAEAAVKFACA